MYGLVPYNISPIQQGIQYGHAVDQYTSNEISKMNNGFPMSDEYLQWIHYDKTYIILNGGTTGKQVNTDTNLPHGTMNQHLITLRDNRISFACFYEPDLGNQLTGIVFLVDERVWNKEKYPDFEFQEGYIDYKYDRQLDNWRSEIGSESNVFLREFLQQFKLA